MVIPKPSTSELKVVMTEKGKLRFLYRGEPLPGVVKIECVQDDPAARAEVRVTFIGLAVALDIEGA
jgi:hypothetical protein